MLIFAILKDGTLWSETVTPIYLFIKLLEQNTDPYTRCMDMSHVADIQLFAEEPLQEVTVVKISEAKCACWLSFQRYRDTNSSS